MHFATSFAAAGRSPFRRWDVLGVAALALIIAVGVGAEHATASVQDHHAGRPVNTHQAASPGLATPVSETLLSGCVIGSWLHSWEEDTAELIVFRPADYPFGPSRGRDGYEFQTGGILIYHGFGPADAPLTATGEWGWHSGDEIHLVVNDPQGAYIDETLRIVSCDADSLQVERVVAGEA